jgi:hypothetical protein
MQTVFGVLFVTVMFLARIGMPILALLGSAIVIERAHRRLAA